MREQRANRGPTVCWTPGTLHDPVTEGLRVMQNFWPRDRDSLCTELSFPLWIDRSTVELLKRLPPLMQAAKEWSCRVGLKNSQTYVRVKGLFKVGLATCTWTVDDLFALISNAMPWGLRSRHLETASVSNMDVGHSLALEVLPLAAFLEALWLFPHKEKRCTLQITSG